jgi:competence protein ComQ
MKPEVLHSLNEMVDQYVSEQKLNALLQSYIANKAQERGVWSNLTITIHHMLGGSSPHIHRLAAITELIILASDIVDDLQDQDHLDKPWMTDQPADTLNAVVTMIIVFFGQLSQLVDGNHRAALNEVSRILVRSLIGQQKDLSNSVQSVDEYLLMVQEKSGSLIRLAFYMGYADLECSEETITQLNDLADCAGLIHQIINDKNDFMMLNVKSDFSLKKRNLPLLYLMLTESEYVMDEIMSMDSADALAYIRDSGCVEYCDVVKSLCLEKAKEVYMELQALSPWKEQFKMLLLGSFT